MTRDEMLNTLAQTSFRFIDPPSAWKDIGFTERPIWVNSKGYGYLMCDEHIESGECDGIPKEKWTSIISKIKDDALLLQDIEDTSLGGLVSEWFDHLYEVEGSEDEPEAVSTFFEGLLKLQDKAPKKIWWLEDPDSSEPQFFFDEQEFEKAYERDWCDYSWDGLEDDALAEWIERLSVVQR